MKILHCADIHFKNDLVTEIEKCTNFMVEQAIREHVDLSIIAGDLFDERHHYDSVAFHHTIRFVKNLARVSPVFILKGTTSHDGSSLKFLESVKTKYDVHVSEQIGITEYADKFVEVTCDKSFKLNNNDPIQKALIFSLPPVSKANLLAYGGNEMEEARLDTIQALRSVLQMFGTVSEEARASGIPTILVGHLTVTGSNLSTGQQMVGREVELGVGDLRMTGADLMCLGHIHKVQYWKEIFYSGSITRMNFGEEEEKGFWIHEVSHEGLSSSRFVQTPARKMVTVNLNEKNEENVLSGIAEGTHVRIKYEVSEEDVHTLDESAIKEKLIKSGASEIKVEKTVIPCERVRAEGISKLNTFEDKLMKWAEASGTEVTDGVIEKLHMLDNMPENDRECEDIS